MLSVSGHWEKNRLIVFAIVRLCNLSSEMSWSVMRKPAWEAMRVSEKAFLEFDVSIYIEILCARVNPIEV